MERPRWLWKAERQIKKSGLLECESRKKNIMSEKIIRKLSTRKHQKETSIRIYDGEGDPVCQ